MKKTAVIALSLVILLAFAGCSGKEKSQPVLQDLPNHQISQNGYYVNLPRQGQWDLYPEMDTAISFQVLTQEPPQDSDFYFDAELFSRSVTWEAQEDEFPFWLYQTYRGMDWNKLTELRQKAEKGGEMPSPGRP